MANDKHRAAREARERFNAELFDKWLKANGYTGKDAEASAQLTPGGVLIIPAPKPMPAPGGVGSGTVTGRVTSRGKGGGKGEVPPREESKPYPVGFCPPNSTQKHGYVVYSAPIAPGGMDCVDLTADIWDLAEARFTETELAEHKVPGEDVCCCFGSEASNDCGILHGTCQKRATVNLCHNALVREEYPGENPLQRERLFPTCTECASAFVKRLGTPLILDFLDHPPMAETFLYLLKLKKEREE